MKYHNGQTVIQKVVLAQMHNLRQMMKKKTNIGTLYFFCDGFSHSYTGTDVFMQEHDTSLHDH